MVPTEALRSGINRNIRFAQIEETQKSDATNANKTEARETRTDGKIFIPATSPRSFGDKSDIIRQVESGNLPLIPLNMEFSSSAFKVGDKIRLEFVCQYEIPRFKSDDTIAMISADPKLKKWFGTSLPFAMRANWGGAGHGQSAVVNAVEVPSDSSLILRHGFMTFAARGGAVLGSIPVNYLAPK